MTTYFAAWPVHAALLGAESPVALIGSHLLEKRRRRWNQVNQVLLSTTWDMLGNMYTYLTVFNKIIRASVISYTNHNLYKKPMKMDYRKYIQLPT